MNIVSLFVLYRRKRKLCKFREHVVRYQKRARGFQSNIDCLTDCLKNELSSSVRHEIRDEIAELKAAANDSDSKAYFWSTRVDILEAKISKTCKKYELKLPKELKGKSI